MVGEKNIDIKELLAIVEHFEKAEEAIKNAELVEGDLALTPVNQLRYGFKHLTQAIKCYHSGEIEKFHTDIGKTVGHCKRSYFDAKDVEITFHLDRYQKFIKLSQDRGIILSEVLPKYADWVSSTTKARKFLENASAIFPDKDERYRMIDTHLVIMRRISDELPGALELVNEKLAIQKRLQDESLRLKQEADEAKEEADEAKEMARRSLKYTKISVYIAIASIFTAIILVVYDEKLKSFGSEFLK